MDDKPAAPLLTKEMARRMADEMALYGRDHPLIVALKAIISGATVCVPAVAAPEAPPAKPKKEGS